MGVEEITFFLGISQLNFYLFFGVKSGLRVDLNVNFF